MGSEDRNFWITDIGGRFRGLYCFGCKEMRKSLSAPTTATTSASKKSGDIPPLSNGKAVAITPSSSSAGSQKKGKTTAPSSSTAADVGAKRKVTHPSTSSAPSTACFNNQTYNGRIFLAKPSILLNHHLKGLESLIQNISRFKCFHLITVNNGFLFFMLLFVMADILITLCLEY
ncbi:uncharacterized protein LOC113337426 [Papaver somniferum]|uniref:uncharacterized protein LOC113337426 n=1 Tax=Papaver somniferum TaxID=3469 RepID=UPI000E6F9B79|nr:uncharacterized protein LOC113337426 [Papaver somniferum]